MIQIHLIAVYRGSSHALMWGSGSEETRATDKAGFPATGTSFLSFCLHIVFGRSPTFRRDDRAALFPIIILFQCSERRRPR
jgi:hypothetical protein